MNLVFLDVDGVLNSIDYAIKIFEQTKKPHSGNQYPFDPKCLERLRTLVLQTDAMIVVTSTWRTEEEDRVVLKKILSSYGIADRVIGYTPILNKIRGEEIKFFLKELNQDVSYIILDDDDDMGDLSYRLVLTNIKYGFTEENLEEAIKKLTLKNIHGK